MPIRLRFVATESIPPPAESSWRALNLTPNKTPFAGAHRFGSGINKHVTFVWHEGLEEIFNIGGDFGYGSNAPEFGQPYPSYDPNTDTPTNQPVNPVAYPVTDGLRMDIYSLEPVAGVTFKLQHPYYPRNIGGVPEDKPAYQDQVGAVYDEVNNDIVLFQHHIRDDQSFIPKATNYPDGIPVDQKANAVLDPWGNGRMFYTVGSGGPWEVDGTYAFTPDPAPPLNPTAHGTWTRISNKYAWGTQGTPATPTYSGNALYILGYGAGHGYLGLWDKYRPANKFISIATTGSFAGGRPIFIIYDRVADTYEYRAFPSDWIYFIATTAQLAVLGDYAYMPVATNTGGVRKSQIFRVNIPNALAKANGAVLVAGTDYGIFDSPFPFQPTAVWENTGAESHWATQVGCVAVNGRLVVIGSYGNLVYQNVTRLAHTANPEDAVPTWTMAEAFPQADLDARAWVAVPKTNEVMLLSSGFSQTADTVWFYKIPPVLTPLEEFAATLSPGQIQEFTTNNFISAGTCMLQPTYWAAQGPGDYGNLVEFADNFTRRNSTKKWYFAGCSRGGANTGGFGYRCGGADQEGGMIVYDEFTNTWSRDSYPAALGTAQHASANQCIVQSTGNYYYIESVTNSADRNLWKRTPDGTWTPLPYPSGGPGGVAGPGALVHFPEMNALLFFDGANHFQPRVQVFSLASETWQSAILHNFNVGEYSQFGWYSPQHGCCYFGGAGGQSWLGGDASKTLLRINAAGVIDQMPAPPDAVQLGVSTNTGHQCIDPVTGDLLCFDKPPPQGNGRVYSFNGTSWAMHNLHGLFSTGYEGLQCVFCPHPDAGVIMILNWNGGTGSKVYVYKHAE